MNPLQFVFRELSRFCSYRLAFILWLLLVGASLSTDSHASDQPNVLFIISDDLNNALGCYGHPLVQTPNIDRLARRGLRFDRAYCQMPFCNPSRSSMLTSLYPVQTNIYKGGINIRDRFRKIVTLPELFRQQGYYTARVGKIFHYAVPLAIGTNGRDDPQSWDHVFNPIGRDKTEEESIFSLIPGGFAGTLSWWAMDGTDDEQTDGRGALETIRLLESFKERKADQPFFLAFGLYRPHTPFVAPKKYFDLYPLESIAAPPVQKSREPAAAFRSTKEEDAMADRQRRLAIQAYYAATTFVDAQVGRVLDALDRLGLAENTIVVFTSDHGYHVGEHGLWQKRSLFEESARVPMIVSAPGMRTAGGSTGQLSELIDLYPTLGALCNLPIPDHVMGRNLSGLFSTPDALTGGIAFTQELRSSVENGKSIEYKGSSIRSERYRYTEWDGGARGVELYDHMIDRREMRNLAREDRYADTLAEMKGLLQAKLRTIRAKDLSAWR